EKQHIASHLSDALHDLQTLGETYRRNPMASEAPARRLDHRDVIRAGESPEEKKAEATPTQQPIAGNQLRRHANVKKRQSMPDIRSAAQAMGSPQRRASMQAPRRQPVQASHSAYMDALFAKARKYLSPDELRKAETGEIDLMEWRDVIAH